ncbi:RNF213 [Mytilus edulis]|uniref:RNF213 n=1 Tax=Mytilus edulis TaxID=6550 RepID=A0A8S3S319_MYTED|nr:RNF213 [Mytilus edulis]
MLARLPPFRFLSPVLQKIAGENCKIIVIAPAWPKQSWFPDLLRLSCPLVLPLRPDLLSQIKGKVLYQNPEKLHLHAWLLSGLASEREVFLKEQPSISQSLSETPLALSMMQNGQSSQIGVETEFDPECSSTGMIKACLSGQADSESRYLLLLTENYGALSILQQKIFSMHNAEVIFGSSFPSDQEYTQVCRNINYQSLLETGSTVILLNLENLYESLYDALNQESGKKIGDTFIGYHADTCAAIIHDICEKRKSTIQTMHNERIQILNEGKSTLLWCATPAAVTQNGVGEEMEIYSKQQQHESLTDYLCKRLQDEPNQSFYAQITTNSRILSQAECEDLCGSLPIDRQNVISLTLQQFHTEQQFSKQIRYFVI